MMTNASFLEDDLRGQGEAEARRGGWGGGSSLPDPILFLSACRSFSARARNVSRRLLPAGRSSGTDSR